jgi:hypothetical protein
MCVKRSHISEWGKRNISCASSIANVNTYMTFKTWTNRKTKKINKSNGLGLLVIHSWHSYYDKMVVECKEATRI